MQNLLKLSLFMLLITTTLLFTNVLSEDSTSTTSQSGQDAAPTEDLRPSALLESVSKGYNILIISSN